MSGKSTGKRVAVIGGGVAAIAVIGGGVWAATAFFGTGAQPAEALPASTLAYAGIDLDPSGGQKIEALQTLRRFPALEDRIGTDTDEDLRKRFFEALQGDSCEGLAYDDDIEPWLGQRAAVAAVDTGEELPEVVLVAQVEDADAAEEGLQAITNCSTSGNADEEAPSGSRSGGWSIGEEWAVVAPTSETAEQVVDSAEEDGNLAGDDTFQQWTGEVGDPGIVNVYAAPEAGQALATLLEQFPGALAAPGTMAEGSSLTTGGSGDDQAKQQLEDFGGLAATVRFEDGGVELHVAGDLGAGDEAGVYGEGGALEAVGALPEDTAAAVGTSFGDGWFSTLLEQVAPLAGAGDAEELAKDLEARSGLELPEDAETLVGDSIALALGGNFSVEEFINSADGSDVPVGVKVAGETDAIEEVLDKVRGQLGPAADQVLGSDSEGDVVAVGPNEDYRSELLEGGGLADSETFDGVVEEAESASAIGYLNFRAGDGWLVEAVRDLAGDVPGLAENLEPLGALGLSAWQEDGTAHSVLRITTAD